MILFAFELFEYTFGLAGVPSVQKGQISVMNSIKSYLFETSKDCKKSEHFGSGGCTTATLETLTSPVMCHLAAASTVAVQSVANAIQRLLRQSLWNNRTYLCLRWSLTSIFHLLEHLLLLLAILLHLDIVSLVHLLLVEGCCSVVSCADEYLLA